MPSRDAAASYRKVTKQGGAPRESEGRALLEAARRMAEACAGNARDSLLSAARLNWRLWTIFQSELSEPSNPVPRELRQNMLNLCNFVDKRTVQILADPRPQMFDVLININRQVAAGLLSSPAQATAGASGAAGSEGGDFSA